MNEEELTKIRNFLVLRIFRNVDFYYPYDDYDEDALHLSLITIAYLYELLHIMITGKNYDYFWHYGNKVTSSIPFDTFELKDLIEREVKNETDK